MHIYSLAFLFIFLPVTTALYYLVHKRYRVLVLLVASLYFYASISPVGLAIMAASVVVDYFLARPVFIYGKGTHLGRLALIFGVVKNLALFVGLSSVSQLEYMEMPLGVAVYCFTSVGYLADLYNGEADLIASPWEFGLFCCFFGKLYVGPIVACQDFTKQLRGFRPSLTKMSTGIVWLLHGLAKKLVLADNILLVGNQLRDIPYLDKTMLSVWLLIVCYIFSAYYTLSGYSDMARGVGAIFGLDLPENFHYPLQAESVTNFFSRFNMSANRFVRKYVYGALGAEDNGRLATTLNIMLITMLMGLWYGIRLNFLVWGASLGVFIVLETLFGESFFQKLPVLLRRFYTLVVVVISFAWFSSMSLSQAWFYLQTMFGFRTFDWMRDIFYNATYAAPTSALSHYILVQNGLLLAACALFCTNLVHRSAQRLQYRCPRIMEGVSLVSNLGLFAVVLAFLM